MAKIKFTAFLADMRGKVAGTVFTKNRAGAIARTKVTPINPNSSFQQAVRSTLTFLSQNWRSLTAAQRSAWNNAVRNFPRTNVFGDAKILSGHQLYVGLNGQLSAAGASLITNPPVPTGAASVDTLALSITVGTSTMEVDFTPDPVPAGSALIIEATAPQSPGKSNVTNQFRQATVSVAAATSPTNIFTDYVAKFGTPPIGQVVHVRAKMVNTLTGEVSNTLQTSAVVA